MREILFRGKHNNEWVYGGYASNGSKHLIVTISDTMPTRMEGIHVFPKSVGQYTGLTDRNGKKIFEHDIVESLDLWCGKGVKFEISFDVGRRGWYPFACGDGCGCCESDVLNPLDCVVIGNIHDNPELLKGGAVE